MHPRLFSLHIFYLFEARERTWTTYQTKKIEKNAKSVGLKRKDMRKVSNTASNTAKKGVLEICACGVFLVSLSMGVLFRLMIFSSPIPYYRG